MKNDILIVNGIAAVLIVFAYWFFFGGVTKTQPINNLITVFVKDGMYFPSMINVHAGKEVKMIFVRKDTASCAGVVNFPQLNMTYELPIDKSTDILLPPLQKGEVDFVCPMGTYHGKLVVM